MICLRWWELILALWVGERVAKLIHAEELGRRAGQWIAKKVTACGD